MLAAAPILALLLQTAAGPVPTQSPAQQSDRDVRALAASYEAAFNKHDAQAVAGFFAESAEYIGPDERIVVGRDEIQKVLLHQNATDRGKDATISVRVVSTRLLRPDLAVSDWAVVVRGTRSLDGTASPPQTGLTTVVLLKDGGRWTIASMRGSRLRPSTPEEIGGGTGM